MRDFPNYDVDIEILTCHYSIVEVAAETSLAGHLTSLPRL